MSQSDIPPLGPENLTNRVCARVIGHDERDERLCGAPAVDHIPYRWEAESRPAQAVEDTYDHGFACAEHRADYQRRWRCPSQHEVGGACGMPFAQTSRSTRETTR